MTAIDMHESHVQTADRRRRTDLGGKGQNLMFLTEQGYRVPPFVVVSSAVFDSFLAELRSSIDGILDSIDSAKPDTIASASKHITDTLASVSTREEYLSLLGEAVRPYTTAGKTYAVRSSVLGEDSQDHSFAGLMQSLLCVRPEDVPDAIVRVWESAFSAGALLYRHRKGISLTDIHAAVIVQEMVPSSTSGVLFTRDPETGEKRIVISAAYGLGEGVVGNLVDTDLYTLDWEGQLLSKQISRKRMRVGEKHSAESGTVLRRVSEEEQRSRALSDTQIGTLVSLGKNLERDTRSPQDIEWAFDRDGTLWLLQTRPIVQQTTHAVDTRIWDNSNIVESYPGLTLPLTFSFVLDAYACSFRRAAEGFFPFRKLPAEAAPIFDSMIGLREGRVYYNLLNWYEMLSYLPGFQAHKKSWDQMIGINTQLRIEQKHLSWYIRWTSALIAALRLVTVERNARSFNRHFERFMASRRTMDIHALSGIEISGLFTAIRTQLNGFWYKTLFNDFAAMKYYDWLRQFCGAAADRDGTSVHNDLLCGERGIESVRPVRSLVAIAELVSGDPGLLELFDDHDDRRVWLRIQEEDRYRELRTRLMEHLRLYGDRGIEELKLEQPGFRDDPSVFVTIVRSYIGKGLKVREQELSEQQIRARAEQRIYRNIRNPFRKILFRMVLRGARHAIAQRENMRFARTRTFALIRQLFRRLGDLYTASALIGQRDDIFYLTVTEALDVVRGTSTTNDLRQLVQMRKREYETFAQRTPGERFITTGIPGLHSSSATETTRPTGHRLVGTPCSSGKVEGEAMVVLDPTKANGNTGKILVARSTDPGWVFLMIVSKGIIVEKGSVLSHTAIIGRELGIPTVVGVRNAASVIPDKAHVNLDGERGVITWH